MLGQNQNPRRERRRFAPPLSSWVLCPDTLGDSYIEIPPDINYTYRKIPNPIKWAVSLTILLRFLLTLTTHTEKFESVIINLKAMFFGELIA